MTKIETVRGYFREMGKDLADIFKPDARDGERSTGRVRIKGVRLLSGFAFEVEVNGQEMLILEDEARDLRDLLGRTLGLLSECHCGNLVAAVAEPGVYANENMVDNFCGHCIGVRCDAYPGSCRGEEKQ